MCRQRATRIQRGAAVTFSDGRHLDACNCSLQLTGDLLFAYLASSIRVACLVASNVFDCSLAKPLCSLSARSVLEPYSRLMIIIGKVISSMVIVLLLSTIPNSFMVYCQRMRPCLRLSVFSPLTTSGSE